MRFLIPGVIGWMGLVGMLLPGPCRGAEETPVTEAAAEERSWTQAGLRLINPTLRELDSREEELERQLQSLPRVDQGQKSQSFGFHSHVSFDPEAQRFVQIDLGESSEIDAIALIPAYVAFDDNPGPGYGFPLRFRIDVSDDPEFELYTTVADETESDYPNPLNSPYYARTDGAYARYVRVTATRLSVRREFRILALAELVVLSGKRNIAVGRKVTASLSIEAPPRWSAGNLVDGQSYLGIPCQPEQSLNNGYHAAESEMDRNAHKWVQVDLGAPVMIDEIRLVPARPVDFADILGFGFPVRFKVDVSLDPTFGEAEVVFDATGKDYPNPGDNLVALPVERRMGRYVRVTATRLWERTGDFVFALAEMEVYAENENVAFGKEVTALESLEQGGWSARNLVDGYSSQYRLAEFSSWLVDLARRHELEQQVRQVVRDREQLIAEFSQAVIQILGITLALLIVGGGVSLWRYRRGRVLQVVKLRNQIARDLHDEIGSNLGSIALLSQVARNNAVKGEEVDHDLGEIKRIALETAQSMREIVWLINPSSNSREMVSRMRDLAGTMLKGVEYQFDSPRRALPRKFSLDVRRNIFLIFKETLHNVVKHSRARHVEIRLSGVEDKFQLTVKDDGCGFDLQNVKAGSGLENLRHRARLLGADLSIESVPGTGTTVNMELNL